ncbi:MAG TPA: pyridoxine 5'-phosphate synthase [Candidatus Omnitrophota bacterium]|nr:pyridoxine 5'-phosphate synthase [Candidatus Omnitrophota bacterium]
MIKLGVNIDHVATLRQARGGKEPDVLEAARAVRKAKADGVTVHLREDRRHIQDADVKAIKQKVKIPLNLEMSLNAGIVAAALEIQPEKVCLVPERREERTTEGGLNVVGDRERIKPVVEMLKGKGIVVSLFIEPDSAAIEAAHGTGAQFVELHTGAYANAFITDDAALWKKELIRLHNAAQEAHQKGLGVNAGHGLNYENVEQIVKIPHIEELNIGHAIVSKAVFCGLDKAVKEMKKLIEMHTPSGSA